MKWFPFKICDQTVEAGKKQIVNTSDIGNTTLNCGQEMEQTCHFQNNQSPIKQLNLGDSHLAYIRSAAFHKQNYTRLLVFYHLSVTVDPYF